MSTMSLLVRQGRLTTTSRPLNSAKGFLTALSQIFHWNMMIYGIRLVRLATLVSSCMTTNLEQWQIQPSFTLPNCSFLESLCRPPHLRPLLPRVTTGRNLAISKRKLPKYVRKEPALDAASGKLRYVYLLWEETISQSLQCDEKTPCDKCVLYKGHYPEVCANQKLTETRFQTPDTGKSPGIDDKRYADSRP